jgi:hypothetical protein
MILPGGWSGALAVSEGLQTPRSGGTTGRLGLPLAVPVHVAVTGSLGLSGSGTGLLPQMPHRVPRKEVRKHRDTTAGGLRGPGALRYWRACQWTMCVFSQHLWTAGRALPKLHLPFVQRRLFGTKKNVCVFWKLPLLPPSLAWCSLLCVHRIPKRNPQVVFIQQYKTTAACIHSALSTTVHHCGAATGQAVRKALNAASITACLRVDQRSRLTPRPSRHQSPLALASRTRTVRVALPGPVRGPPRCGRLFVDNLKVKSKVVPSNWARIPVADRLQA